MHEGRSGVGECGGKAFADSGSGEELEVDWSGAMADVEEVGESASPNSLSKQHGSMNQTTFTASLSLFENLKLASNKYAEVQSHESHADESVEDRECETGNGKDRVDRGALEEETDSVDERSTPSLVEKSSDAEEARPIEELVNGVHEMVVTGDRPTSIEANGEADQSPEVGRDEGVAESTNVGTLPASDSDNSRSQQDGGEVQKIYSVDPVGNKSEKALSESPSSTQIATPKQRTPNVSSIAGDVMYNITAGDGQGRSRQRILSFAAKRYSNAVARNPEDYDAIYNWALVLQESADITGTDDGPRAKDTLLEDACKKYEAATQLCPTLHEAFYNWAIAISDRAKIRGRTKEAEELWKQACEKYDKSVQLNWSSPQALNNWGLALQELSAIVSIKEKRSLVRTAIRKFRAAIRLRFDFHRAIYNLGTVLYGLAEDTLRGGRHLTAKEHQTSELYSQSAVYIAAAHSLKPDYPVYRSALRLVRSMLPLPYLKMGYLRIPPLDNSLAPHSDWKREMFVLDHEALYQTEKVDESSPLPSPSRSLKTITAESSPGPSKPSILRIQVEDIAEVIPCADLSLPPGGGFCINTPSGPQYLVAETWEAMDGWADAIRLVYTIYVRGKTDVLAGILAG
ncbi:hypothetical protein O6H91_22G026300 [Diphasiastrum complanatum]|uniref:Uncharacterized protein n=1 Tax=Diphasiastrum complanatum TaxID=34168 RepID=A0ACC2AFV3_DIPCM|nr:hypothetical protein O6H91_22G026300 [Diphasiastrum complanatum]